MITSVHLRHFKCFETLDLPLGKLTLLTGRNASGKSSVIQSLLLLHQNIVSKNWGPLLMLNGDSVSLGTVADVLDTRSGRGEFSIGLSTSGCRIEWKFGAVDKSALTANLISIGNPFGWHTTKFDGGFALLTPEMDFDCPFHEEAGKLNLLLGSMLHLSTERTGPRETYPADREPYLRLGAKGEYVPWFLHRNETEEVSVGLRIPNIPPQLPRQTEAWLAHFFPGAGIRTDIIPDTNLLTMRFRTSAVDSFFRASNVGYGLSHVLPVIVGGLGIDSGDLLIVENPEAHLHPSGQSEIGKFLGRVAASGSQVLIESHSDHVLNGIRRMVLEGALAPEDVLIYFFDSRDAKSQVVALNIGRDGAIDNWPAGFFDQLELDLKALTHW